MSARVARLRHRVNICQADKGVKSSSRCEDRSAEGYNTCIAGDDVEERRWPVIDGLKTCGRRKDR